MGSAWRRGRASSTFRVPINTLFVLPVTFVGFG